MRLRHLLLEPLESRSLLAGDISYSTAGATYSQNFNGLPNVGTFSLTGTAPQSVTAAPINANVSMEGWYVSTANNAANKFTVSNSGTASVYSYGSSTSDRALGGLANNSFAPRYGAVIRNNTGTTLGSFSIAFTEEQWWANTDLNGRHVFEYKVGATSIHDVGFQADSALDLTKIVVGGAEAVPGNNATFRTGKSKTIAGLNWAPGETLVIRWSAGTAIGAQGMAIDDLSFTAFSLPDNQPVAQNDGAYAASEDTPLDISTANGVLSNDTGLDDGPLSLSVVTTPAHGTVTLNNDGSFIYTPAANFYGNDSFQYKITDADGDSAMAVATISVASVDDLPIASNDSYEAVEDTPLTVNAAQGVFANDIGLGDGGLTVSIVAAPSHGNVTINNDGSFTYTPATNYAGADVFTYQVADSDGDSSPAVVALNVAGQNDSPKTINGAAEVNEDSSIVIDLRPLSTDVETSTNNLLYEIVTSPSLGELLSVVGQPGVFTFTPSPDFHGDDTFTFRVKDEAGAYSNTSSTTITIRSENDPPILAPIGDRQVNEKSAIGFVVSADDPHDTPTNSVTLSVSGLPEGAAFNPLTGVFNWTPSEGQQGTYSLTFTATDDGSPIGTDSETISIIVNEVNDPPFLAPIGNRSVPEESLVSFIVVASDPDDTPKNNITLSVASLPEGASFDPDTGTFLWTPAENQQGTYQVTFTATDNGTPNASDSETVTFTVSEVNDAPVLAPIGDRTGQEGSLLNFFIAADDRNDDPANQVSLTIDGLPTDATFNPATGEFRWLPTYSGIGMHTLTFWATDDGVGSLTDSETITITIASGNLPPTLDSIPDPAAIPEDASSQSITLSGISQGGDTFGGALKVTATTDNPNLFSSLLVSYSGDATGSLSYQPAVNASGTAAVTVTVRDAGFDAVLDTADDGLFFRSFTVSIKPVNDEGVAVINGVPEQGLPLAVTLSDAEGLPEDITYRWEASTDGNSEWTVIPGAVEAVFVPRQSEVGQFLRVVATYTDRNGTPETVASTATNVVANVNDAPYELLLSNNLILESAAVGDIVGMLSAFDLDDTAFTFSVVDPSGTFTCVGNQLVINGSLDFETATSYPLEVTVGDSAGGTFTREFTIAVDNVDVIIRLVQGAFGEEVRIADEAPSGRDNDLFVTHLGGDFIITSRNGQTLGMQGIAGEMLSETSVRIPASFLDPSKIVFNLGVGNDVVELDTASDIIPTDGLQVNLGGQAGDTVVLSSSQEGFSPARTWSFAGNGAAVSIASLGNISLAGVRIAKGTGGSDRFVIGANASVVNLIADGSLDDSIELRQDGNFTLSDDMLVVGNLNWTVVETIIHLEGVSQALLTGGQGNNTFDLTAWTGSGSVLAGLGSDTIKLRTTASHPDIVLSNQNAVIHGDDAPQLFALSHIERAELSTPQGHSANHTFTLQDWTGTTDIQAGAGVDTLVVAGNLGLYELGSNGTFKVGAMGNGTSQGIDQVQFALGSSNNIIRLRDGFSADLIPGGLKLQSGSGHDMLEVIANADFLVSDSNFANASSTQVELSYHSGSKYSFDAQGFERYLLTGGNGDEMFTFLNFSGLGGVNGVRGNDTVRFVKDANFALYKSMLQVDGRNLGLSNVDSVVLGGGDSANQFVISGWTGKVMLDGGTGPAIDSVRVFTSASNVVLADSLLRLDQQTVHLANSIEVAALVGSANDQTFNLSGWSNGAAILDGTSQTIPASSVNGGGGNDTLVIERDADITVADRWLTYDPVGPSRPKNFALANLEKVVITGGAGNNFLSAASFTGPGGAMISGRGGNDVLIGSVKNDTLIGEMGNDWLAGRGGKDHLFGGLGRDILSGGDEIDYLMGGVDEDVLITGRTIYDTHRQAIDALLAAWGSLAGYNDRTVRLRDRGVGNGYKLSRSSVVDDGAKETLPDDGNAIIDDWFILENTVGPDRDAASEDRGEIITDLN